MPSTPHPEERKRTLAAEHFDRTGSPEDARRLVSLIAGRSRRPVQIMEFCGGHTHAILKYGLRHVLPQTVMLLSGPGCPVCVTARADIDTAIALASTPGVILATFGDMMRVPGSDGTLLASRAQGADVRVVYSSRNALDIARSNPGRQVVFLGIGFETTAPTVAAAVQEAEKAKAENFSVLSLHKLTPPAMKAVLESGRVRIDGIIGPGHVTTIIGAAAWDFLPRDYGIPCAIAGFEPLDILHAIYSLVDMIERRQPAVSNTYARSVDARGNRTAQNLMATVFETCEASWRGLGRVPRSGLALRPEYAAFDAAVRFATQVAPPPRPSEEAPKGCRCGEILRGVAVPTQCPLFGAACTPERPVGPCMVSSEGACAAYIRYGYGDGHGGTA
jgi:hydrogenase expression/formation protein HypD